MSICCQGANSDNHLKRFTYLAKLHLDSDMANQHFTFKINSVSKHSETAQSEKRFAKNSINFSSFHEILVAQFHW